MFYVGVEISSVTLEGFGMVVMESGRLEYDRRSGRNGVE